MQNSPYLDRPLLPLAVALPRMLAEIETALATTGAIETRRLRQRAELIRELLTPRRAEPLYDLTAACTGLADPPQPCVHL
jgi:hypothetical protein